MYVFLDFFPIAQPYFVGFFGRIEKFFFAILNAHLCFLALQSCSFLFFFFHFGSEKNRKKEKKKIF
jgi:hypothetical protein